jgi:hypothetical protein
MGVMNAGIPAFRRRPIERELEVGFGHLAHDETFVAHGGRSNPQARFAAATSPSVT